MPVLAIHTVAKGQVVWLASDETWRWRANIGDQHFTRFWGQMITEVAARSLLGEQAPRTQVTFDRSKLLVGVQDTFHVRVLDGQFRKQSLKKDPIELTHVDDAMGKRSTSKLVAMPVREGEYTVLIKHDRPGRFELRVNNSITETFHYRVELPGKKQP